MKNSWLQTRGFALGYLLVGGTLAMFASAQPWWRDLGEASALRLNGTQVTRGLSQALAIVTLAGAVLMLVLRRQGRRVLGAVLQLVGIGVAVVGGFWMQPRADAVRDQLGHAGVLDSSRLTATAWPWISVLAGALIVAGGVLTVINAARWPSADRFQSESGKAQHIVTDEAAELWKALDAGVDPTAAASVGDRAPGFSAREVRAGDTDDHDTPRVPDPEMRDRRAGDTMDGTEQAQQLPWAPTTDSTGQVQQGRGDPEA